MNLYELISSYDNLTVLKVINLDEWHNHPIYNRGIWLKKELSSVYKPVYDNNERIILTLSTGNDVELIKHLDRLLRTEVDISECFVVLATNEKFDSEPESFTVEYYDAPINEKKETTNMSYDYNGWEPTKIDVDELNEIDKYMLKNSKTFCIYPWMHLHAYPTGEVYPCCSADMNHPLGSVRENTMEEVWNSPKMKELRVNMLRGKESSVCTRCYEQEASGFFSGRRSANKHHGHHIGKLEETHADGQLDKFELSYWDVRFSNLCNLSCRSCGHIFSSSWYKDQVALAGPGWGADNSALQIAGRNKTDMFEQLMEHIDYCEQIYFAGGEPLMMEEHYKILDELERREMFHVRLIYNTNFTQTKLKDRDVFSYWKKFDSVSVGASLDAMGPRAEYIRKGTKWDVIESNRRKMMEVCPDVDFYISATLSIMNAIHIVDFHRDWVEKGLIQPQDFNINILQDPPHYRIDIAPEEYKQLIRFAYKDHLYWLKDYDKLNRASTGFRSALKFLDATDNSHLVETFWEKTLQLDEIRNECIYDYIPELENLYVPTK